MAIDANGLLEPGAPYITEWPTFGREEFEHILDSVYPSDHVNIQGVVKFEYNGSTYYFSYIGQREHTDQLFVWYFTAPYVGRALVLGESRSLDLPKNEILNVKSYSPNYGHFCAA